jgi:hypothetical protein
VLIVMLAALLTGTLELHAQSRTATTALAVQIRQEELLQVQTDQVALKIRLARGRTARIWSDMACTSPSPGAIVITKSGIYTFPLSDIQPVNKNPGDVAGAICLESSDGALHDSIPLNQSAPEPVTQLDARSMFPPAPQPHIALLFTGSIQKALGAL